MDFLTFYPKGRNVIIEFVPDKYINWQPQTESDIPEKLEQVGKVIEQLKSYCLQNNISQMIVLDCDKAIHFEKINYVLMCKFITRIHEKHPDHDDILRRIEIQHCHPAIKAIMDASRPLLPKRVVNILHISK